MKKGLAILIPLCIIGFVGFWISSSLLGKSSEEVINSNITRADNLSASWNATDTIVDSEYNATIAASENLVLDLSNVKAVVKPTDADDIKVYVKNTSERKVKVSLNRGSNETKITINTNIVDIGVFGINLNPLEFIKNDNVEKRYVEIDVPKTKLNSAKISVGSGMSEMKGIEAEDYDIYLGSGKLDFDCGTARAEKFKFHLGSGTANFSAVNATDKCEIKVSSGSANFGDIITDKCDIHISSGNSSFGAVTTNKADVNLLSGGIEFKEFNAEKYDVHISSGTCALTDLSGKGDIKMSSGKVYADFKSSPAGKLDIGSGYAEITIPEDTDTKFKFDIGSGKVNFDACGKNEKRTRKSEDDIVIGSGENTYEFEISSGKADIKS